MDSCDLFFSVGTHAGTIADLIAEEAQKQEPSLAWAEPDLTAVALDNQSGRRADFIPLVRGAPNWPHDLRLVEARLFWPNAALHATAEDQNVRWVRFEENSGDDNAAKETVTREQFDIETVRDRRRFGLGDAGDGIEKLSAILYRRNGRLIAWRLVE